MFYLDAVCHSVAIKAIFSVDSRYLHAVLRVLDILQVRLVVHKNRGIPVALLRGNSLELRDEPNLGRLELVD